MTHHPTALAGDSPLPDASLGTNLQSSVLLRDSEGNTVSYGFDRGEDQTFREIVGTVSTCLHLMFQDHFFQGYLSAYVGQQGEQSD